VKCIEENKDVIVGIKIRLSESISNAGANEEEAYRYCIQNTGPDNFIVGSQYLDKKLDIPLPCPFDKCCP
jgi:hypothetical protein